MLREGQEGEGQEAHEAVDGGGYLVDVFDVVEVEEAFADDAEGEFEHLRVEVGDGAGLPAAGEGEGLNSDDVGVGGDAVAQEGGLGEAALTHVERLFGGEEAVAEDLAAGLHDEVADGWWGASSRKKREMSAGWLNW